MTYVQKVKVEIMVYLDSLKGGTAHLNREVTRWFDLTASTVKQNVTILNPMDDRQKKSALDLYSVKTYVSQTDEVIRQGVEHIEEYVYQIQLQELHCRTTNWDSPLDQVFQFPPDPVTAAFEPEPISGSELANLDSFHCPRHVNATLFTPASLISFDFEAESARNLSLGCQLTETAPIPVAGFAASAIQSIPIIFSATCLGLESGLRGEEMIIKRSLRGQMPALKRRRTDGGGEGGGEEAAGSLRKKRRADNLFPLEMLADIGISAGLPYLPEEFRRYFCVDAPFFPGEAELEAAEALRAVRDPAKASIYPPPPIVRTSRGRTLVRPSRFNDSVIIDSSKKEKPMLKQLEHELDFTLEPLEYGKPSFINPVEANTLQLIREEECYRACRNFSVRRKYSASLSSLKETFLGLEQRFPPLLACIEDPSSFNSKRASDDRRKDYFVPEDFVLGDVVWAKSGKKYPIWPAIVINPMQQAPAIVLHSCIPGALCDYGWVKQGMIFPFIDNLDRFQGQKELHRSKPCDFRMAIDEAFLAENGFFEAEDDVRSWAALMENHQSVPRGIQEDTGSNHELEGHYKPQATEARLNIYNSFHLQMLYFVMIYEI
ncbi:Histone-lysine N-methyltransferase ATX5 [Platanthera guangdongensis]|uniref:Histone-lysine N-methyltransferase ATX5 n=1 Tax=Platanthera guangdongensis TaxID=2320717 RepID=A0ABR2LEP3_9ASPA